MGYAKPRRVVAYTRVSTSEQADRGVGLEAQRAAIAAECERRSWELVGIHEDAASGGTTNGRHGLERALAAVERGEASALVVAKLDRLSRSLRDFAELMERSRRRGWALVALDLGVDTTTPAGEMMANVVASVAQYERRLIGQRTKDAMDVKRRQGVHLGRRSSLPPETVRRIARLRHRGLSLRAIADRLNAEGAPRGQGGKRWYAATVRDVLAGTTARSFSAGAAR